MTIALPELKIVQPKRNEKPPVSPRGRGLSEAQVKARDMVANLTIGEWYKVAVAGEKEQRATTNLLRTAVQAVHEGMSIGVATDESHVWFVIQPRSKRGRKPKGAAE